MSQPPTIPVSSRPAPVNPFYNQGMAQPISSLSNVPTGSNPFESEPPPYNPPASSNTPQSASAGAPSTTAYQSAPPPPLPSRSRLSPHTTGSEMDLAPSPRRSVPPLPSGGMMHAAPAMPPSRISARPLAPPPPERPNKGPPQLPARLNNLVSSVATPERKAQATKTYDRVQEGYGRVVTRERQEMAWRGVQKVGEGVVGLVGKIKGPEKK